MNFLLKFLIQLAPNWKNHTIWNTFLIQNSKQKIKWKSELAPNSPANLKLNPLRRYKKSNAIEKQFFFNFLNPIKFTFDCRGFSNERGKNTKKSVGDCVQVHIKVLGENFLS